MCLSQCRFPTGCRFQFSTRRMKSLSRSPTKPEEFPTITCSTCGNMLTQLLAAQVQQKPKIAQVRSRSFSFRLSVSHASAHLVAHHRVLQHESTDDGLQVFVSKCSCGGLGPTSSFFIEFCAPFCNCSAPPHGRRRIRPSHGPHLLSVLRGRSHPAEYPWSWHRSMCCFVLSIVISKSSLHRCMTSRALKPERVSSNHSSMSVPCAGVHQTKAPGSVLL
jgi:hypothetical protein